jgi:hypothetical protein
LIEDIDGRCRLKPEPERFFLDKAGVSRFPDHMTDRPGIEKNASELEESQGFALACLFLIFKW